MKSYFLWLCNAVLLLLILYFYQRGVYTDYLTDNVQQQYDRSFSLFENANEVIGNHFASLAHAAKYYIDKESDTAAINPHWREIEKLVQQNNAMYQHTNSLMALLYKNKDSLQNKVQTHLQAIASILQQNKEAAILSAGLADSLLQALQQTTSVNGTVARTLLSQIRIENSLMLLQKLEKLHYQALFEKPILYDAFTPHVMLNKERFEVGDTLRAKMALIATPSHAPIDVYVNNKKIPMQSNGIAHYKQVCKEIGRHSIGGGVRLERAKNDSVRFYFNHKYQVQAFCPSTP
jgi:hypothetical protein